MSRPLRISGGARLQGEPRLPGDKSISHRALMLAARGRSASRLRGLSPGADVTASRRLIESVGAKVTDAPEEITVEAPGRWPATERHVDCANSGTTMRLGMGLLAGRPGVTVLSGDASLSGRPMSRVTDPLCEMGARIETTMGFPPVRLEGGALRGGRFAPATASAQVKGAILLAGLDAQGDTEVIEAVPTRAHTEELLRRVGATVVVEPGRSRVSPGPTDGLDLTVPADPSAAVFWAVAATICSRSHLRLSNVYRGPARDGWIDVLRRMGADLVVEPVGDGVVDIEVRSGDLSSVDVVDPGEVTSCIDELPALMVAAALADGITTLRGAGELRVKESDRLAAMSRLLRAFGVEVDDLPDGLRVHGGTLTGARVDSGGDHRIAMAAAVAGLAARGDTVVHGWEAAGVSDPGFEGSLVDVRIGW